MPKSRYSTALVLSITMWGMPVAAGAQTRPAITSPDVFQGLPDVAFQYYDVYGTDEASISASLAKNAPTRPDGSKAMGATGYRSGFRPFQVGSGSACKVTKLNVYASAVVILPRLIDESGVPEGLLIRWKSFVAGLREHEAGHVRIEYEHRSEIERALIGSRCNDIKAKYDAAAAQGRAFQKAYDRETNHGETQGAVLR